jgi:hypothetical protein
VKSKSKSKAKVGEVEGEIVEREVVVVVKSRRVECLPLHHYSLIIIHYSLSLRLLSCRSKL